MGYAAENGVRGNRGKSRERGCVTKVTQVAVVACAVNQRVRVPRKCV